MSKKLFVGNLPFNATEDKLKEAFSSYGEVSEVVIIKNKFSGRSKGFGFVTMANDGDAEKAIAEMNGKDFEGRAITVNEAKPMEERPQGSFQREGGFRREGFRRERRD